MVVLLTLWFATIAAGTLVRIQGRVMGRGSVPLRGVEITLEAEAAGLAKRSQTDATGAFSIEAIEAGRYRLRVRYGETEATAMVDLPSDQRVDITLDVAP